MLTRCQMVAAIVALGGLALPATAQEPVSAETEQEIEFVKTQADAFFHSLTDKTLGPDRAFRELIGNGPLKDRTDEINKLIDQAATLDQSFGPYSGHELASSKAVGEGLIFLRYIYKGERFPVVFHFIFYRAAPLGGVKRNWSLIGLRFDARVEALEK